MLNLLLLRAEFKDRIARIRALERDHDIEVRAAQKRLRRSLSEHAMSDYTMSGRP